MLSEKIKELRIDNNKLQKEISELLGIHQSTYSNYESGKAEVSIEKVIQLAIIYETNIDYLVGLTDIKEPYPSNDNINKEIREDV